MTIKAESNLDNFDDEEIYKEHFEDALNIAELLGQDEEKKHEEQLFKVINNSEQIRENEVIKEISEENPSESLDNCDYDFS
jgi:hypothetical protein